MRHSTVMLMLLAACTGKIEDTGTPVDVFGLDAPDAPGFQLHIEPFDVPVGTEVQNCYYLDFPGDVAVDVTRIQFEYATGSHHVNVFRNSNPDLKKAHGTVEEECWTAPQWDTVDVGGYSLVANSQLERLDWTLPDTVGVPLGPEHQFMLQVHYVNIPEVEQETTEQAEVFINFHAEPAGSRVNPLGSMFANNRTISIPAHEYAEFTASCMLPANTTVMGMAGHFHRSGEQFTVNRFLGATEQRPDAEIAEQVYQSDTWEEPPFQTYNVGDLVLGADEGLSYTCSFFNDTDETIIFGPHVETDEHCNLFAYYYPATPTSTFCF